PATIFIGDIGTLGLGAAVAAGVILGHIEFYGVIAIAPAFYEMIATAYFGLHGANGNRRKAYRNPVFLPNGEIAAPAGTKYYTLASWLLSRKPRTEKGLVRSILLLFRLHRRVRFNLIYIHSLPDFQVFCALPFKCMRIPVLLDLHEPMPEIVVARLRRPTGSAWFRISAAIERLSCLFADHVIVANDGIRDAVVSRRVSPSRVTTVYNVYEVGPRPVSPEEVRRRLGLPEGRLLVHAGGVSPERDLATLVEAVALLPGHDDIHLVIAGEGAPEYIEALRGLAHDLGLGDRIRFVPKM